jgi:GNAT superfamily N-acetyltransferase
MDEVLIRKAILNDIEQLYVFEQGVVEAERPYDPTLKAGVVHYYDIEEMIRASHIELLVAVIQDKVVGSGYARIENAKPYLKHKQYAYLGFMYTHPDYRGRGINQKIIETLQQWALTQYVTELRLEVYSKNISAIKAYEKCGFTNHMIEMRLNLEG